LWQPDQTVFEASVSAALRRIRLTRSIGRFASLASLVVLSSSAVVAAAQQQVPPAQAPQAPAAPAPAAAPVFPKPDPANFTSTSLTKAQVDGFLTASWGYDENRIWEVEAILKTQVEGYSKVIVFVGDKTGKDKPFRFPFIVLPGGKWMIYGEEIFPFGNNPYAELRATMQQRADGPYRGSESKDLEIVEFADLQCPHCKAAQANMDQLVADFPKAHIVFQHFPLPMHSEAKRAAEFGVCVAKQGGSSAFFTYAASVFDGQDGLSTPDGATLTLNAAVTKAGLDPVKIAACAAQPATVASVDASAKLARDANVNETPTLVVNGRQVPANIPYQTLKQIIQFQMKMDGIQQ
jgi:protein-disulfide isomerase